jgi:hypothetical protein
MASRRPNLPKKRNVKLIPACCARPKKRTIPLVPSPHSPYEFTGKDDFGFETLLGKIFGIEPNYKTRIEAFSQPSSRTGLLPSSPLRTVHESFPSHSSSPSNASFRETRFRDRKSLVVNPVMALRMK